MSRNIFEIWRDIGQITPRDGWSDIYYTIVEDIKIVKWPYGKAYGQACKNGTPNDHYNYNEDWKKNKEIPSAGVYQWDLVEDADIKDADQIRKSLEKDKKDKIKKSVIYEIESKIKFGKYKGKTIKIICKEDPNYILWLINNVESAYSRRSRP